MKTVRTLIRFLQSQDQDAIVYNEYDQPFDSVEQSQPGTVTLFFGPGIAGLKEQTVGRMKFGESGWVVPSAIVRFDLDWFEVDLRADVFAAELPLPAVRISKEVSGFHALVKGDYAWATERFEPGAPYAKLQTLEPIPTST